MSARHPFLHVDIIVAHVSTGLNECPMQHAAIVIVLLAARQVQNHSNPDAGWHCLAYSLGSVEHAQRRSIGWHGHAYALARGEPGQRHTTRNPASSSRPATEPSTIEFILEPLAESDH